MKMAKASEADMAMAIKVCSALEAIDRRFFPAGSEGSNNPDDFDLDDDEHCGRVLRHIHKLLQAGSIGRVIWGMYVLIDPRNELIDPGADTLERHPDDVKLRETRNMQPLDEWHEDKGNVLWWRLPIEEPPYCGTPNDSNWPGYHTYWTPLVMPIAPDF